MSAPAVPKDIVVFIEDDAGQKQRLAYAVAQAAKWHAHLIATFVADWVALNPYAGYAAGAGISKMLQQHKESVEQAKAQARTLFEEMASRAGISHEWRVSDGDTGEALMLHARHASLAIIGPPSQRAAGTSLLSLSEDVIFASGRPSLLLPPEWPEERLGRRIVVGWNASREATRAIASAMPFLQAAEAVHLVVVPESKINQLLGADPGADISRHLARHGVHVVLEQLSGADAGATLIDHAHKLDADMLVMGAYGQSKISEFVFGGATRRVLSKAECPILLSR